MTILVILENGLKIAQQTYTNTSGVLESGNAGTYNRQSGCLIAMKDLNYVIAPLGVQVASGPMNVSGVAPTSLLMYPSVGMVIQSGGQKVGANNVVQVRLIGCSGECLSGYTGVSGVAVTVQALGY